MVPPRPEGQFRQGFTCPALLDFTTRAFSRTGLSPAMAHLSRVLPLTRLQAVVPSRLRAAPLSLIATWGISVDFFSSGYLDISVPRVRLARLCIQRAIANELAGFPHSEIPGSKSVADSPRLIAGCHVLHRLQLPRHPPNALVRLTI